MLQLNSQRLQLSLIENSDLEEIHNLHSIPEVDKYNTLGIPDNKEVTKRVVEECTKAHLEDVLTRYTFKMVRKTDQQFIGLFGLNLASKKYQSAEIWFKIHPEFWNQGYTTEAVNLILDFCFKELKLHRVTAGCAVENIASIKVLEKVGMTHEGRCRKTLPLKSGWSDNFEYAILESDERKL